MPTCVSHTSSPLITLRQSDFVNVSLFQQKLKGKRIHLNHGIQVQAPALSQENPPNPLTTESLCRTQY